MQLYSDSLIHCVKSVGIRSFSGADFPAFVSLRVQSECGEKRTRKTPNTDTFHAVMAYLKSSGVVSLALKDTSYPHHTEH